MNYGSKEPISIGEIRIHSEDLKKKTASHPCFTAEAHRFARLHLPVAPKCNIQCNYCSRRFDCVNESRPGVTSQVLTPTEAAARFAQVKAAVPGLTVVGISGPGDPLANIREVLETVRIIRTLDKEITFCLSTNGLELPKYASDLAEAGITHFTVTMNAVDPVIGAKIYRCIHAGGGAILTGEQGAMLLMQRQLEGLAALARMDVVTKVNIVAVKGVNDAHIRAVAARARDFGASSTNIMPLIPVPGTPFANNVGPAPCEISAIRESCSALLPQIYHCRQCRADAIGELNHDVSQELFQGDRVCHRKNIG